MFLHHPHEFGKEIIAVVRAGGGFGMILNAKGRVMFVFESFHGFVVQINMCQFHL